MVALIFGMSCNMNPQTNSKADKTANSSYKISVDRFISDKNIPQIAKDLYYEKVKPTDNDATLALIDSISSTGQAQGFYFLVATKTMKHADGAYSEPLGIAAKEFVENNTIKFLSYFMNNPNLLSKEDFKSWANSVYGEIQIESEDSEQKAVKDLRQVMRNNCKGQPESYRAKIDEFIGLLN